MRIRHFYVLASCCVVVILLLILMAMIYLYYDFSIIIVVILSDFQTMGMAAMLDVIINYINSLPSQIQATNKTP